MKIDGIKLSDTSVLAEKIRKYLEGADEHGRWATADNPTGNPNHVAEYDKASTGRDLVFSWSYDLMAGPVFEIAGRLAARCDGSGDEADHEKLWRAVYMHRTGQLDRDGGTLMEVEAVLTYTGERTYLFVYDVTSGHSAHTVAVARWLS